MLKKLMAFAGMALIVCGFVTADIAILLRSYLRPDYVEAEVQKLLGRTAELESIDYGFTGVEARNFRVPGRGGDLVSAENIRLTLDRGALLDGRVAVQSVELKGPQVRLFIDREGRCDLLQMIAETAERLGDKKDAGGSIPRVTISGGTLEFWHESVMGSAAPLVVRDVTATISPFGQNEVAIDGSADAGHLGRWKIEGRLDTGTGKTELTFSSRDFTVGPSTVAGFSPEIRNAYDMYKAAGVADISVRFTHDASLPRPLKVVAEVRAKDLEATYHNFPWRAVGAAGLLRFRDDGIEFQDLHARMWMRNDGTVTTEPIADRPAIELEMRGSTDGYDRDAAYHLYFDIRNLPINAQLRNALQPGAQNVYDMFQPSGAVTGKVEVVKATGPENRPIHIVQMQMLNCAATFKPFPYPVTDVTGEIFLDGDRLFIRNARCRHEDAVFHVNGELSSIEPDGSIQVAIEGTNIPLDKEAFAALPDAVKAIWKRLNPSGLIDLSWKTAREEGPDKPLAYDVTVFPKGVVAKYEGVPYPLEKVARGSVRTDTKTIWIKDLEGEHGTAKIRVNGTIDRVDGDPKVDLVVDGEEIPIDGELRAALPVAMAQMMTDVGMKGTVTRLERFELHMDYDPLKADATVFKAKNISLADATFDAGLEFTETFAELTSLDGKVRDGNFTLFANIKNSRCRIDDFKMTDITAIVHYEDGRLGLQDIQAQSYDGRVSGSVYFKTDDQTFDASVAIADVDLLSLSNDTFVRGKAISGKLGGSIELNGKGADTASYKGSGGMNLKDSELWEVPFFVGIFDVLSLGKKDSFRSGEVQFKVDEGRFKVREMHFDSDSLGLDSDKGWMDFDGKMAFKLSPKFKNTGLFNIPKAMFGALVRGTSAIQVTGTFKRPDVKVVASFDIEKLFK